MKLNRTLLIGGLLAIVGTTLFTGKVIVAKLMYTHGLGPSGVLALRMAFALPFFLAPALRTLSRPASRPGRRELAFVALTGLLGYYAASFFDFTGVQYISTALERMILNTYPSVVMLLGVTFLGRRLEPRLVLATFVGYAGIAIIMHEEVMTMPAGSRPLLGAGLILLSVLTYSASVMGAERLMRTLGSVRYTSLAMTVSCLAVLTHYLVVHGPTLPTRETDVVLMGAFLGLFCTVVPAHCFNRAVQMVGAQRVGLFGYVGMGVTFALSALLLNEHFTLLKTLGIVVSAFGAFIVLQEKSPGVGVKPIPVAEPKTGTARA